MQPTSTRIGADRAACSAVLAVARRGAAVVLCCLGSLLLGAVFFAPQLDVAAFAAWARGAGAAGVAAFVLVHVGCALLLVPSWPVRVAAGFVYGAAWGFGLALLSSFAGCLLAFAAGRRLLHDRIAPLLARDPRLAAIDQAVAGGGLWIVFLLRLSPVVPNELVNYGLAATRVRTRDFAWATLFGLVPLTASFAWFGSLLLSAGDLASGRAVGLHGVAGQALWWTGLATTVALVVGVARLARGALGRSLAPHGATAVAPATIAPPAVLAIDG
jgi:uncharacterized membrane protein YdjX (TVP38/TMEM64 family)